MPRSKRNKVVSLTKVNAKGRDLKQTMIETLRASMDSYSNLFHLKFENLRSSRMRDIRMDWKESRLFLGKNSVAKIALGRTEKEEYKDNMHLISQVKLRQTSLMLYRFFSCAFFHPPTHLLPTCLPTYFYRLVLIFSSCPYICWSLDI